MNDLEGFARSMIARSALSNTQLWDLTRIAASLAFEFPESMIYHAGRNRTAARAKSAITHFCVRIGGIKQTTLGTITAGGRQNVIWHLRRHKQMLEEDDAEYTRLYARMLRQILKLAEDYEYKN